MTVETRATLPRHAKGPIGPPPVLAGALGEVVAAVSAWPAIETSVHWYLFDQSQVDGVDFYLGEEELGHLHLDGSIHLATSYGLGRKLIAEGVAKPFRYQPGWVEAQVRRIGAEAAIALFRRNYEHLQA